MKTKDFDEKKIRENEYSNKIEELESALSELDVEIEKSKSNISALRDLAETEKMKQKECERMRNLLPEEFSDSVAELKQSLKEFESMVCLITIFYLLLVFFSLFYFFFLIFNFVFSNWEKFKEN